MWDIAAEWIVGDALDSINNWVVLDSLHRSRTVQQHVNKVCQRRGAPVLRISNAVIQGCSRSGIYAVDGTFILDRVELSRNAGASGGGASITVHACISSMHNCTVTGNEASTGAGLFFSSTKECRCGWGACLATNTCTSCLP
jgi:hypothetical protein